MENLPLPFLARDLYYTHITQKEIQAPMASEKHDGRTSYVSAAVIFVDEGSLKTTTMTTRAVVVPRLLGLR